MFRNISVSSYCVFDEPGGVLVMGSVAEKLPLVFLLRLFANSTC